MGTLVRVLKETTPVLVGQYTGPPVITRIENTALVYSGVGLVAVGTSASEGTESLRKPACASVKSTAMGRGRAFGGIRDTVGFTRFFMIGKGFERERAPFKRVVDG
jgi:hypothetical protein